MEKTNKKKALWGILAGAVVAVAMIAAYICFKPGTSAGAKEVTIQVVDNNGETTSYDVKTDAEYLKQAMDEAEGLTYSGDESEYGMMVTTVNGVQAVYDTDGAYWAFYVNDDYCNYGIEEQPVNDQDTFKIEYTPAQ